MLKILQWFSITLRVRNPNYYRPCSVAAWPHFPAVSFTPVPPASCTSAQPASLLTSEYTGSVLSQGLCPSPFFFFNVVPLDFHWLLFFLLIQVSTQRSLCQRSVLQPPSEVSTLPITMCHTVSLMVLKLPYSFLVRFVFIFLSLLTNKLSESRQLSF